LLLTLSQDKPFTKSSPYDMHIYLNHLRARRKPEALQGQVVGAVSLPNLLGRDSSGWHGHVA